MSRMTFQCVLLVCAAGAAACGDTITEAGVRSEQLTAAAAPSSSVVVCHAQSNGSNIVLTLSAKAANAHLAHGDTRGGCVGAVVLPAEGSVLPQNNAQGSCSSHPTRGYGSAIAFDWEAAKDPRNAIVAYHLVAKNVDAINPIVDVVIPATHYDHISCNGFVIDRSLTGWQWMVRAVDRDGNFGAFTRPTNFSFEPCRLADGTPCRA